MVLRQGITLLGTVLCALIVTHSWAASMQPARIGEHEASLAKRIKFPEVEGNYTVFLRCEAKVLPAGKVEQTGCYSEPDIDPAFYRAVNIASTTASVTPATVGGENVNVLMLFSVIFRQQEGQRVIAVVPNHGTNAKEFGMSYISPQRYGRSVSYNPRTELGLLWIDADMSADGKAKDITYLKTEWTNKESERYAKSYINEGMFIPGHLNGAATTMRFVKPIFGYRNGFMWENDISRCGDSTVSCDEASNSTGKPRFVFDD